MLIRILSLVTLICLFMVSVQDLKERQIYTMPVNLLTIAWFAADAAKGDMPAYAFILTAVAYLLLFWIFNRIHMWGEGDSDLFLLFGAVYQYTAGSLFRVESLCVLAALFAGISAAALAVAKLEAVIRKTKLNGSSKVAVAPGFFIIIAAVITKGGLLC